MAEVGNGPLSARKRRDMNGTDNQSPVKKMKLDDEDPPEANPNAIEAVRHRNKEMALDLLEKNRRISFLTQKCESLFRQGAVSQRAFRCIQRQWVQLIDDVTSASDVLSLETPDEWRDVVAKTESLGVLRLPTSVVTVALPQWFLAISRGDKEVELKDAEDEQEEDDDDDGPEEATEPLDEKEQIVQKALQEEQQRVKDVVQKLLAAVSNGSTKPLEFKELIAQKREATAQALRFKDDLEAVKRKLTDVETDLEAKEVERHQACRAYDRLKEYVEKLEKETAKTSEAADSVKVENGADQAGTQNDAKSSKRAGDKHVTLVDPDVKPSSADREVLRQLNADKVILLQKLKEERQHVESMRSELNRLRAVETASKQEEMRLKQEFEATVARLQDEKANAADVLAAARLHQTELLTQTQEKWKSQLDKIQEDTIKTKAKFNDLVFKNTALREKLASFSAYRDQLSDLKSLHEALKRETERLQGDLKRAHARREREDKVEETKKIVELREKLAVVTKERDELKERVTELTASLEKSGNAKLAETLRRETQVLKTLEDVRVELATSRADVEKARAELATAHANHDAFKDENDALVAEIDVLGKEVESARHSKKKVLKQLDEKRQSAKKMQSELAKESGARAHATEELATVRLQVSSLKYVHTQQKAALEAAKDAQKATDQELAVLKKALEITQTERDVLATEKAKADRDAEVAKQMFKAEATHKQRQVLQDKSRPCDKCESYRKKEAELEKRLAALRASASSSGGDANNSGLTDLERFELQDLRKQLKCSVCQDRHKDVIISKCSHLFCKECIDSNLRSRNRKCPTCKKMYGQDDVKSVWFT